MSQQFNIPSTVIIGGGASGELAAQIKRLNADRVLVVTDRGMIELDVEKRRLHIDVTSAELKRRRAKWRSPRSGYDRGYVKLYIDHVEQANRGADLDFLVGSSGSAVPRESH